MRLLTLKESPFLKRLSVLIAIATFPGTGNSMETGACNVTSLQSAAPKNSTVLSAELKEKPVRYCKVVGYTITDNPGPNKVGFGLHLPEKEHWNNRFYFIGVGGSGGGKIPDDESFAPRVAAGYATAGTDKGHPGIADWSFSNDPAMALDNAHRGAHVSTVAAQALTKAYYGASELYRYHTGCSGGGDMGMKAIQVHPDDYDGVLLGWVGGPHPDPEKEGTVRTFNVLVRESLREPGAWLSPETLLLADEKVLEACDIADGARDNLIQDTRQCEFDFDRLICKSADQAGCLTQAEATSLKNILRDSASPISNIRSWSTYLGSVPPPWTPPEPGEWGNPRLSLAYKILQGWARTYLKQPDREIVEQPLTAEEVEKIYIGQRRAGDSPVETHHNVDGFGKAGGKAIFYVGVGDPAFPHVGMENYFNILTENYGETRVADMARLYQVPGWGHCGGGTGPSDGTDVMLEALIEWVESDQAPEGLVMHRGDDRVKNLFPSISSAAEEAEAGAEVRGLPVHSRDFLVCPYPDIAVFDPSKSDIPGAVYEAENWSCKPSPYIEHTRRE